MRPAPSGSRRWSFPPPRRSRWACRTRPRCRSRPECRPEAGTPAPVRHRTPAPVGAFPRPVRLPHSPAPPPPRSWRRSSAGSAASALPRPPHGTACPAPDRPPCRPLPRPWPAPPLPRYGFRRTAPAPARSAGTPPAARRRPPVSPASRRIPCGWWACPAADRRRPCRADRRGSGSSCVPAPARRHRAAPCASPRRPAGRIPASAPAGYAYRPPARCIAWPHTAAHRRRCR